MKAFSNHGYLVLLCCLLVIFSGCASLFSGVSGSASQPTSVIKLTPTPTSTPTPLTDSDLARSILQGMTLDQKLGKIVIVDFYGATLNSDLAQMIQGNRIGRVLYQYKQANISRTE